MFPLCDQLIERRGFERELLPGLDAGQFSAFPFVIDGWPVFRELNLLSALVHSFSTRLMFLRVMKVGPGSPLFAHIKWVLPHI